MKLYQSLEYQVSDRIAFITLNRPEADNAINHLMIVELEDAILSAEQDVSVKVILLRAHGAHFSKGFDEEYLGQVIHYNMEQNRADSQALAHLLMSFYRATKVIIAQVQGDATAIGAALICACDVVFAAEEASIGFPEVHMGLVPAVVMPFLLRRVGEIRTKELLFSGMPLAAPRAAAINLINQALPAEELPGHTEVWARHLCQHASPASLQLMKKMIADLQDFPMENAIKFVGRMNAYARATEDAKRGMVSSLQQNKIEW
ncbi:MAG: enoyl-CoA hydratase-related protein [Bacteroidota bacterium]